MMPTAATHAFTGATLLLDSGFRQQARLAWRLLRDERVSPLKYALPALVTLYVASPIDALPDFLLGVGQMDDLGLAVAALMVAVRLFPKLAPRDIVAEHAAAMNGAASATVRQTSPQDVIVDAPFTVRT